MFDDDAFTKRQVHVCQKGHKLQCVQGLRAQKDAGAVSGSLGLPGTEGHSGGRTSASRVRGKAKKEEQTCASWTKPWTLGHPTRDQHSQPSAPQLADSTTRYELLHNARYTCLAPERYDTPRVRASPSVEPKDQPASVTTGGSKNAASTIGYSRKPRGAMVSVDCSVECAESVCSELKVAKDHDKARIIPTSTSFASC